METGIAGMITIAGYHRLPDLLAVRQFRPRQHHLILTPRTHRLRDFLIEQSRPFCQYIELIEIDAFKPFQIYRVCSRIAQQYAPGELILNLAGGTKPLMLLAYEACREYNHRVLFYDPFKRAFTVLSPEVHPLRVSFRLDMSETLQMLGYRLVEHRPEEENSRFRMWALRIGREVRDYFRLMSELHNFFRRNPQAPLDAFRPPWQPTVYELELLEELKLWANEHPMERIRRFAAGGWLLDYIYWAVRPHLEETVADAVLEHVDWQTTYRIPILGLRHHTLYSFWYVMTSNPMDVRDWLVEIRKWTKTVGQGISKNYLFTPLDPYQHKQLLFMARRMHIFLMSMLELSQIHRVLRFQPFMGSEEAEV